MTSGRPTRLRVEHHDGFGSLNHYSKGAVISFLHQYVAGIRPDGDTPAYRHFRIQPMPGGDITWAEAQLDSPHGRIASSWRIEGEQLRLDVTVPPGTTADIALPDGTHTSVAPGTHSLSAGAQGSG